MYLASICYAMNNSVLIMVAKKNSVLIMWCCHSPRGAGVRGARKNAHHTWSLYPCSQTWISCVQAFLLEWMKWTRISIFTFWEHSRKQPLSQHDSHDYSSRTNKIQPEEIL